MSIKAKLRGSGFYHLRGTYLGVRVDRSAGTRSKQHADILAAKAEREIFERYVKGPEAVATFAEAAADYLRAGGEGRYMTPLIEKFGLTKLAAIDQAALDMAAIELYPDAGSSTRRRQVYAPFIACWKRAEDAQKAPVRKWKRAAEGKRRIEWRTPEEAEAILAELEPNTRGLVTFYLGAGLRATEALDLVWRDISPAAQRVTLWADITKAEEDRSVDLGARVRSALPQRGGPDEPVFLNSYGEPWHAYDAVNLALKRACRRAKVRHTSCHVLRHSFATWAYAVTRDLEKLMEQGGWATPELAMRYMHGGTDDVAKSVRAHGWELLGSALPRQRKNVKVVK
jgi:integrase